MIRLSLTYYNRGNAYSGKGDYNRAIADYEAALQIDPSDTDIRDALEDARQALGH
jgi:tetratricopeptide (TPR) repeat protein